MLGGLSRATRPRHGPPREMRLLLEQPGIEISWLDLNFLLNIFLVQDWKRWAAVLVHARLVRSDELAEILREILG